MTLDLETRRQIDRSMSARRNRGGRLKHDLWGLRDAAEIHQMNTQARRPCHCGMASCTNLYGGGKAA